MASIKQGTLVGAAQWWKHLKEYKREFWKRERQATKDDVAERLVDDYTYEEFQADICTEDNPCEICRKREHASQAR
jgi:hypothetical protein